MIKFGTIWYKHPNFLLKTSDVYIRNLRSYFEKLQTLEIQQQLNNMKEQAFAEKITLHHIYNAGCRRQR